MKKEKKFKKMSDNTNNVNFQKFIDNNEKIKSCSYRDSQKVLGNTFDMIVIQDFEALTPNVLCRVIETVAGSGIIIFVLGAINSLQSIYNLNMDVHSKFKTSMFNVLLINYNYLESST